METIEQKSDGRFKPGQSGNPVGRPTGSRSRLSSALDAQAAEAIEEIVQGRIEAAKGGDTQASKIILERMWPTRKGAPIAFKLPEVATAPICLRRLQL